MGQNKSNTATKIGGFIVLAIFVFIGLIILGLSIVTIEAGEVGVVYSVNGGVRDDILRQGWHFKAPTEKVTKYKIISQQLCMSKDAIEGSPNDESFDANCSDGIVNVDVEMTYSINENDVVQVFKRYGGLSGEKIVDTYVRAKVKAYVKDITSKYTVIQVVMDNRIEVNNALTEYLKDQLKVYGITVESVNLSRTDPDPEVLATIVERSNMAQQIELKKKEQEAIAIDAENKKIQAQGEADKKLIEAKNEAEMEKVKADAEAYSNKVISDSITSELIALKEAEARLQHGWVTVSGADSVIVSGVDAEAANKSSAASKVTKSSNTNTNAEANTGAASE